MSQHEAAAPEAIRARPVNTKTQNNPIPPAPPKQERPVALWRFMRWPWRIGIRCSDTTGRVFAAIERLLAGADYVWLIAADGRMIAVVDGGFFEAMRRAAYNYSEPLLSVYELNGGAL